MHTLSWRRALMAAVLLGAVGLTACESEEEAAAPAEAPVAEAPTEVPPTEAPAEPAELVIGATDYGYELPENVVAGSTRLTLMNKGQELHQAALFRLADGKTAADVEALAAESSEEAPLPDWMIAAGGPVAVAPTQQASTFVDLEAGTYVLLCAIPDAEGVPHMNLGQMATMEVGAAPEDAAAAAAPEASAAIGLGDFAFTVDESLPAGAQVIEVTNNGAQPHESVLMKLNEGATAAEVAAAFAPGASGPPPAMPVGGVAPIAPGAAQRFPADLSAGRYALLCFLPDPESGKPHVELGMMAEFDVK